MSTRISAGQRHGETESPRRPPTRCEPRSFAECTCDMLVSSEADNPTRVSASGAGYTNSLVLWPRAHSDGLRFFVQITRGNATEAPFLGG
jgi:hypothetical protein